jgi:quinol monooxygenase YgiN
VPGCGTAAEEKAMYGSILRAKIKPGQKAAFERFMEESLPSVDDYGRGLHSVEVGYEDKDSDRAVVIIHFRDKESYIANAERPDTNSDWERQREFFEGDVEWIDLHYQRYIGKPLGEEASART